jgi:lipopolysaccharide assembly protein A
VQTAKTRKSAFGRFFFVCGFPAVRASRGMLHLQYGSLRRGHIRGATRHQASVILQPRSRDSFMKFIVWLIRVLVFVLLLVLAFANTQPATLNFLAGYAWQAPLILIGLAFFVVGLLAGLLSSMPAMVRLRLENGRLKRELRAARETPVVVEEPPLPPLI